MSDYLGEGAIKVIVSPGRAGYLVPDGDVEAFERAITIASSRWGGVTEPIIVVTADGSVSSIDAQTAGVLDLMGLVDVGCPDGVAEIAAASLSLPVVSEARMERTIDLRSLPWHVGTRLRSDYVAARPNGPLWEKVAAGVDPTAARHFSAATEDNAGKAVLGGRSMLEIGLAGLAESEAVGPPAGPLHLWITTPDSLADCQAFWNYRTLRCLRYPASPIYLLPEHALTEWLGLEETLRAMVRERQFDGSPDVVINSLTVEGEQLKAIGEQLGLTFTDSKSLSIPSAFSFRRDDPKTEFTFATDVDPSDWLLFDRTLGYDEFFRVQVFREGTAVPVLPEGLRPVIEQYPGAPLRFRMSGGFLDDLPRTPSTGRGVLQSGSWSQHHLQSIVGVSSNGLLNIHAPSAEQVLALVTADVPGGLSTSDKGRMAASLRARFDLAVLNGAAALAAIQALTTRRSKALLGAIKALEEPMPSQVAEMVASLGGRVERNFRSATRLGASGVAPADAPQVLEDLSEAGWVERGVKIRCAACGISSFVLLAGLNGATRCPQCDSPAGLERGESGVEVFYRLNAFVDRCSDQGVVTHTAVGAALEATATFAALHLGADVVWPDGDTAEVDLFGFLGPRVVAGEVKTSASEFTDAQVDRDVALSARLGAEVHVLAYVFGGDTDEVVTRAGRACDAAGLELLVVRPGDDGLLRVQSGLGHEQV